MPTVIYAVLIFAVLGFAVSYVLVNGAKKDVLSENEQLENDEEFKKRIKIYKNLIQGNVIYGILIFLRARFLVGHVDMTALNTACIVFLALNFFSEITKGIVFSSSVKSGEILENKNMSKALFRFMLADLTAIAGLVFFFLRVKELIL